MPADPIIAVFLGGTSSEREVSLGSGAACAQALALNFKVETFDIRADAIPAEVSGKTHVVFSTLHGGFGENGGMQRLLHAAGIHYAGCDEASSALTIDKAATKRAVSAKSVRIAEGLTFSANQPPSAGEIISRLGEQLVLKPNDQGSSVGLHLIGNRTELETALATVREGTWLIEQRISGRELSVGVLQNQALGVVEIRPKSGVYDFSSKYTKGLTEYFAPAPMSENETATVRAAAQTAFSACGCRDYARVDFIFSAQHGPFLLEINPLPGMKETSLLPMSARCLGLDFPSLVKEMVTPALRRFRAAASA